VFTYIYVCIVYIGAGGSGRGLAPTRVLSYMTIVITARANCIVLNITHSFYNHMLYMRAGVYICGFIIIYDHALYIGPTICARG
jgi:hypothetical protein